MKKGELEAKKILEKLGEQFDEDYHDDNSKSSMLLRLVSRKLRTRKLIHLSLMWNSIKLITQH